MSTHHSYFKKLKEAIELEYAAELEKFKSYNNKTDLKTRIEEGYSIYPLVFNGYEFTYGEQIEVTLESTKENIPTSRFRNGSVVSIFDNDDNEFQGIIKGRTRGRTVRVIIKSGDMPDWIESGKIGLNLLPDSKTQDVIKWAFDKIENAKTNERVSHLRDVILSLKKPEDIIPLSAFDGITIDSLNDSQLQAVKKALSNREISLLHGPPGTGKTTTIVQIVKQLLKNKERVLVAAPSNMAVDWLSEKLIQEGINVVRTGNPVRISPAINENSLDYKISNHPEAKLLKKWRADYLKTIRKAKQFKRVFDEEARAERKQLFDEARELKESIYTTEKQIIDQILSGADVISCTLTGAGDRFLNRYHFDTAIVDEAGQALEPLTWIVTLKADRVLLAGDPHQLPATVKNPKAIKLGLEKSLLEKTIKKPEFESLFLDTQYRMNEEIMHFSNNYFYGGKLKAHESNAKHRFEMLEKFMLIDTAGTGMNEKVSETKGKSNPDEAKLLVDYLKQQLELLAAEELENITIGVLSPYADQVLILRQLTETDDLLRTIKGLRVNTIDSFQGQEKEVIYISLVRSNENNEIGFLRDYRRMNVAMTRAKKSLTIIGDSATISTDGYYAQLIDYAESINAYKSAWEFLY